MLECSSMESIVIRNHALYAWCDRTKHCWYVLISPLRWVISHYYSRNTIPVIQCMTIKNPKYWMSFGLIPMNIEYVFILAERMDSHNREHQIVLLSAKSFEVGYKWLWASLSSKFVAPYDHDLSTDLFLSCSLARETPKLFTCLVVRWIVTL